MTRQNNDRIGDILKQHGELTAPQVAAVLDTQKETGRPFGDIAGQMFGVNREAVERAWVQQYLGYNTRIDLSTQSIDPEVLPLISRREARQFQMIPLKQEDGLLYLATSKGRLPRAAAFAWGRFKGPVYFLVAPQSQIEACLETHYPWSSGVSGQSATPDRSPNAAGKSKHDWGQPKIVTTSKRFTKPNQKLV